MRITYDGIDGENITATVPEELEAELRWGGAGAVPFTFNLFMLNMIRKIKQK